MTYLIILQDKDVNSVMFHQAAAGWTFILCSLKTYLETGEVMSPIPSGEKSVGDGIIVAHLSDKLLMRTH